MGAAKQAVGILVYYGQDAYTAWRETKRPDLLSIDRLTRYMEKRNQLGRDRWKVWKGAARTARRPVINAKQERELQKILYRDQSYDFHNPQMSSHSSVSWLWPATVPHMV